MFIIEKYLNHIKFFTNAKKAVLFKHILNWVNFPEKAKNVPIGKNRRRGRPRNTESALNRQNDDKDYTVSSGTSTSSNAEKSPDTNQMLNELGLGDSNAENKSNDFNDTVNDQDEFESDLIDREGDVEEDSDKEKNQNVIESNEKNYENE